MIKSLCVFCGSSRGIDPTYMEAAAAFGRRLAENDIRMIYGGGNVGLMGAAATAAIEAGGEVYGVITEQLNSMEVGHLEITQLEIVPSMHERKARMASLSDGFVALPGGIGTLEEIFEALTWTQLGIHHKPCALYNLNGFYDSLIDFLKQITESGFLREAHKDELIVEDEFTDLLKRFNQYQHRKIDKLSGAVIE